jgi:hypothetical protein
VNLFAATPITDRQAEAASATPATTIPATVRLAMPTIYYAVRCPKCRHWELPTPFPSLDRFPNRRMDPPVASCRSGRIVAGRPCDGMWVEHRLDGDAAHDAFMRDRGREAEAQREQAKRAETPQATGQEGQR